MTERRSSSRTSNGAKKSRKRKRTDNDNDDPPKALPPSSLTVEGLGAYLEQHSATGPFKVLVHPLNAKKARRDVRQIDDIFEERLRVKYSVNPFNAWEHLKKYKRFTVGEPELNTDVSISQGEYVYVKNDDEPDNAKLLTGNQWKAIVMEIRAADPQHVYLLVAWLNRPEDLPDGRKDYHGRGELIPSNQLDVIDAGTVNGRLEMMHWDEDQDDIPEGEQYFWRQTYDAMYTKTLSQLPEICIDEAPHNPDELIVQCTQADCKKWMHPKCIARDAAQKARGNGASKQSRKAAARSKERPIDLGVELDSAAVSKAHYDGFTAEVFLKGYKRPVNALGAETNKPVSEVKSVPRNKIAVTDSSNGSTSFLPVHCLLCQARLD